MFDSMRRTSIGSSMSFESAVNSIWDLHKQLTKSFVTGILEAIAILIHKGPSIPNPSKLFYTFVSFHLYLVPNSVDTHKLQVAVRGDATCGRVVNNNNFINNNN